MQTKTVNIYTLDELSPLAKEKALREWEANTEFTINERNIAIETFNNLFQIFKTPTVTGLRLRTWLVNNIQPCLQKGEYYSLWSKIDINPHYIKGGTAPKGKLKIRYSNISVMYNIDEYLYAIFHHVINYIDNYSEIFNEFDIYKLKCLCLDKIYNETDEEIEHIISDEGKTNEINGMEYKFYKDGTVVDETIFNK